MFKGKNVDTVGFAHDVIPALCTRYDLCICTEMLEHDKHWKESLTAMYSSLRHGGLLLITAAGEGRKEHGTFRSTPQDSPGTNEYCRNISIDMFFEVLPPLMFREYFIKHDPRNADLQFYGIRK